jgi:hypothetical protein
MDRPYRHFTLKERRRLFRLVNAKLPIKEIAGQLGRYRSRNGPVTSLPDHGRHQLVCGRPQGRPG